MGQPLNYSNPNDAANTQTHRQKYLLWLIVALLLFGLALYAYRHHQQRLKTEAEAKQFEKTQRETAEFERSMEADIEKWKRENAEREKRLNDRSR